MTKRHLWLAGAVAVIAVADPDLGAWVLAFVLVALLAVELVAWVLRSFLE